MTLALPDSQLIPSADEFCDYVLGLNPRVAVFDCDGTLWSSNSGEQFFRLSLEGGANGVKALAGEEVAGHMRRRYAEYEGGTVGEIEMCGEMVSMYGGLPVKMVQQAAQHLMASLAGDIFPEMLKLTRQLVQRSCKVWAVSSSSEWLIAEGIREFGIPLEHVLATRLASCDGIAGRELLSVPSDENKASVIRENIKTAVDAAFGNSIHDAAMLDIAEHAFAVNPTPELEQLARERGWKIYWPQGTR